MHTYDPKAKKVISGAPVEDAEKKAQKAFVAAIAKRTGASKTAVERALRGEQVDGARTILGAASAIQATQANHAARAAQFGGYHAQ